MRRLAVLLLPLVPLFAFVTPARAADVTVTLEAEIADVVPFSVSVNCDLEVDSGSDGIDVLNEAVDELCIESYDSVDFGGSLGEFVTCINRLCGQAVCVDGCQGGTFWAIYVNGTSSSVGVSNMSFTTDATLGFNYETWGA